MGNITVKVIFYECPLIKLENLKWNVSNQKLTLEII